MRLSVFYASAALAASLVLSACSSGSGTQAVPGGSQSMAAPMGHHAHLRHLAPVGFKNNDGDSDGPCTGSNPALFYCYYMYPGTSFSQEFAELNGSGNYIPGSWNWKSPHFARNYSSGKAYSQIEGAGTSKPYGWNPYKREPKYEHHFRVVNRTALQRGRTVLL